MSAKALSDHNRARELFIQSKPIVQQMKLDEIDRDAKDFVDLSEVEFNEICQYFGMQKVSRAAFEGIKVGCNMQLKVLYFPLEDLNQHTVGYRKLSRVGEGVDAGDIREESIPRNNSYGAVIASSVSRAGVTTKKRDSKTAILVLSLLDFLALRMQQINCE